jgi:4,5-DOPA dioxygenase extradiol
MGASSLGVILLVARIPAVFISHGSPMTAVQEDEYARALRGLGSALPRPRAAVVVSAHWESGPPVRITGAAHPGLIHDFSGFPDELFRLTYPAPGDPGLAREIASTLSARVDERRGLDHGVWVPLRRIFPAADLPVVEVSLTPGADPRHYLELGKALSPLRDRGVLLLGSGGVVHNLRRVDFENKSAPVDGWAREFDDWVRDRVETGELVRLLDYRRQAPHAELAVPTTEHFDPLFVALGAGGRGRVKEIYAGFHHANLSMRSFWIE